LWQNVNDMETSSENNFLIVGLGNPGKEYEKTRHNAGFLVVETLAEKWGFTFKKALRLKGSCAKGKVDEKSIFLLLPDTYMNLSGEAVRSSVHYFKVEIPHLLVVVDDVDIPFGEFRLKDQSGCGGHKGLQSVEMQLQSTAYARLRIGVGDRKVGSLEEYVLSPFTEEEAKVLPRIIEEAIEVIHLWLMKGMKEAMNRANRSRSNKIS
jgi:peptidyl-tRNA hydrolase, PTH1 family